MTEAPRFPEGRVSIASIHSRGIPPAEVALMNGWVNRVGRYIAANVPPSGILFYSLYEGLIGRPPSDKRDVSVPIADDKLSRPEFVLGLFSARREGLIELSLGDPPTVTRLYEVE